MKIRCEKSLRHDYAVFESHAGGGNRRWLRQIRGVGLEHLAVPRAGSVFCAQTKEERGADVDLRRSVMTPGCGQTTPGARHGEIENRLLSSFAQITRTLGRLEPSQVQHDETVHAAGKIGIFTEVEKLHPVGIDQIHVLAIQHG